MKAIEFCEVVYNDWLDNRTMLIEIDGKQYNVKKPIIREGNDKVIIVADKEEE